MKKVKLGKSISAALTLMMCFNVCSSFSVSADEEYYGDVNDDKVVDLSDLTMFSQFLLSDIKLDENQKAKLDFDFDGVPDLPDLAKMKQYVMNDPVDVIGTVFAGKPGDVTTVTSETDPPATEPPVTSEEPQVTQPPVTDPPQEEKEWIYYACDGEIYLGVTETTNGGFTGPSYVNYDNVTGSMLTFTVNVPSEGNYEMTVRFANGTETARPLSIYLNGSQENYSMDFGGTGAWTSWQENKIVLPLKSGENKIKTVAVTSNGGPNVDYIKLVKTDKEAASVNTNTVIPYEPPVSANAKQMERLDRGLISVSSGNGMLVSWRALATDPEGTEFRLYRDGSLVYTSQNNEATTYFDASGSTASKYMVETYINGIKSEESEMTSVLGGGYMDIRLNKPSNMSMPDGSSCSYSASDCSIGDVDGDGEYEIFVKWDPDNAKDNSQAGHTGNVYIDCYKLNGKQLWRIDLGRNIRAGAHYTQFMVYDFDGDGKAEMICKTADGTKDGTGKVIGDGSKSYSNSDGYILDGPEYLTVFNGQTGAAMDTISYTPARGTVNSWGDKYGNRVDRFLAGVAYLNGKTPSVIMCRGYYTRAVIVAYDWNGSKLTQKWVFDSEAGGTDKQGKPNSNYSGQGNHNLTVTDVDGDGFDEIVYGSCCIDHDGRGLYSTGLNHGDAIHVSDFLPERPGLEVWQCHESSPFGSTMRDAATGQILFRYTADKDTGRCCAGNIIAGNNSAEFWGSRGEGVYDGQGKVIASASNLAVNFVIQWDGDFETELLDGNTITEYTESGVKTLFTSDYYACNGTKNTPNLTADIFGDWREELILHSPDSTSLRIYSTPYYTGSRIFTFMHDSQYRTSVAAQNTAYNQPPHTSFFMGTGYALPKSPAVYYPK